MTDYAAFNARLIACENDNISDFISQNITDITPAVFEGDNAKYLAFKKRIAKKFLVNPNSIFIVGSGALGFSYRKDGKPFNLQSDIDVAIVDEKLFEEYSKILASYHYDVMYHRTTLSLPQKYKYRQFLNYYAVGWLRPDKGTDIMNKHPQCDDWWKYFLSLSYKKSEVGDHKVNAGIYKSEYYLHKYQEIGLLSHKKGII